MKITFPSLRPRNPYVAAAMRRVAGPHRASASMRRQDLDRALRRDLVEMKQSP